MSSPNSNLLPAPFKSKKSWRRRRARCRAVEGAFYDIGLIVIARIVAPEPAHHVRKNGAALLLSVQANPPGIVDVVPFFGQRFHQPNVLIMPVVGQVWGAVVVHAIA